MDAAVRDALALGAAHGDRVHPGGGRLVFPAVSTDTRSLPPGALFVALRGERFDAHDFLQQAADAGASGAVVERIPEGAPEGLVYYLVPDTLEALGRLARYRRRERDGRVCAITGTNGKTSTKEMVRAVLACGYRVHATTGNLNNLVGAPLTLLRTPLGTGAMVVEVGTNEPGEIGRLAAIVEPDAAIITSVAEGHLEGLGSVEGVLEEKVSLLGGLPRGGVALVGEEPPVLAERARSFGHRVRVAGWTGRADPDLRAEDVVLDEEGRVRFRWRGHEVRLRFRGRHHARNALLALGIGEEWGIDPGPAIRALEEVEPMGMRGEIRRIGGLTVIVDCYNSNPASLDAALDLLISMPPQGGRVAVVGTMRELGPATENLHRRAAEALAGADVDLILATGEFAAAFAPLADALGRRVLVADDPVEAYPALAQRLTGREVILLKGSRGVELERLLPLLEQDWAGSGGEGTAAEGSAAGCTADGG